MGNREELNDNDFEEIEETEHILHMWEPLSFETYEGYKYRHTSLIFRFFSSLLHALVYLILIIFNALAFGFTVKGKKKLYELSNQGFVTISNHVHPMDCTMVGVAMGARRMNYITLESNFRIPVIRHIIKLLGGVPLSKKPHEMTEMFAEMKNAISDGECVHVYPETVMHPYYDKLTRKFQDGAFRLAYDARSPVVPLVFTFHEPFGIFKLYKRKPIIRLSVLDPVYPDYTGTRQECITRLKNKCKSEMNDEIKKYTK